MNDNKYRYKILVADDEDEIREAVCEMVDWEQIGYELVGSAANGLDAMELVEKCEPDLVLSDICMPFISGIELARMIHETTPSTRIAFISGHDDFEYAKYAIRYNVISYLLKPITTDLLVRELVEIRNRMETERSQLRQHATEQMGWERFVIPALLDSHDDSAEDNYLDSAVQCGLLSARDDVQNYAVMIQSLLDADGKVIRDPGIVASVSTILSKYSKTYPFYSKGRIITLMAGKGEEMNDLYIPARELSQTLQKALNCRSIIGVSHTSKKLSKLPLLYQEALEAHTSLQQGAELASGNDSVCFISDLKYQQKHSGNLLCDQALEEINKSYTDPELSLALVSRRLHVSPNYLSAIISKTTGDTFSNLLTRRRMEEARRRILASQTRIQEIAETCGYSDQHYFSYCFKKYFGESPNSLRRKMKQGGSIG